MGCGVLVAYDAPQVERGIALAVGGREVRFEAHAGASARLGIVGADEDGVVELPRNEADAVGAGLLGEGALLRFGAWCGDERELSAVVAVEVERVAAARDDGR